MTVVFDIDGVLAQNHERADVINCNPPDWDTFFLRCAEDSKLPLADLIDELSMETILLTSRPERTRKITEMWLQANKIHFDELIMVSDDWYKSGQKTSQWKVDRLVEIQDKWGNIQFIFEDNPKTIWEMRDSGWPVIPIYSGYYECPKRRVPRV